MNQESINKCVSTIFEGGGTLEEKVELYKKRWDINDICYFWEELGKKHGGKEIDMLFFLESKKKFDDEKNPIKISSFYKDVSKDFELTKNYFESKLKEIIFEEESFENLIHWHEEIDNEFFKKWVEVAMYQKITLLEKKDFEEGKISRRKYFSAIKSLYNSNLPKYLFNLMKEKHNYLMEKGCFSEQINMSEIRKSSKSEIERVVIGIINSSKNIKDLDEVRWESFLKHKEISRYILNKEREFLNNSIEILEVIEIYEESRNKDELLNHVAAKIYNLVPKVFTDPMDWDLIEVLLDRIRRLEDFAENIFYEFFENYKEKFLIESGCEMKNSLFLLNYSLVKREYYVDSSIEEIKNSLDKVQKNLITKDFLNELFFFSKNKSSYQKIIQEFLEKIKK